MEKSLDFYPCFHLDKRSNEMHLPNDCISSLPVEVLLIILSLLPLKEMVKTSILSKRWLNLWVNTPVLVFYFGMADLSTSVFKYFVNLVDHVLQQHKSPYLKEFRICCNIMNDHREYVDRWLEFALARKVQILELNFLSRSEFSDNDRNYVFPNSWFISSGKAIVDGGKSRVLQFNLKFLKSLILKNVNVTGETINFFLQNCPFLERLELVGSQIMVNLVISDPTLVLKYLKVKNCRGLKVLCISNINLVSLDTTIGYLILEDLPMLVELSIYGYANNLKRIVSQNATCLRQLKSLELTTFNLKGFTEMLSDLAQLTKLKRLVIHYGAYYDESLIVFLDVIKSCNYLEEFVLELDWLCPKRLTREMQKVERFSFESLKLFEFKGYFGRASDVELIMHVVENAPRLEKIIIDGYDTVWRLMNYPEDNNEKEARRHALEHIKFLKQIKYIPPHIDVLIR